MNKKAKAFRTYLKKAGIEAFEMEDMHDDELHTVIFRTFIEAQGTKLPLIFVLDDTLYGSIRVLIAPKVLKDGNEMAVYQLINEYNRTYKSFKYCIDEEGALLLDMCYISNDDVDGDILSVLFDVIIQHLEESYRPLMKAIWN
ncbi:YbjN domain-containing protein [Anaeroglobus geminatus]|jgi:hypothetical protein|uniref:Bacterial sensory transduction regulator n=1 Tax=Anaeroglobus geminatus F0357 TaxID=861450 RepID=G9YF52_9FIRM|nr:YbjN domain-containing protein [Anaeroglobus geminatus]EHM43387.1 hypothetical protein HMPREF0080_00262 [Anaeroglobus geminatus F0357]